MAKKISASDIFESEDIFKGIKESAEQTIKKFTEIDAALKKTAEGLKKDIGGADFGNTKGINNFVSATQKATKTQKDAVAVDKVVAQAKKDVIAADKALVDIEIKKQKLAQEQIKTNNAIAKTETDKAKATEKAAKAAIDESNAYKQLSNSTRDLKNQSKELGAQMLILEQNGRKNSKEYRELANSYKKVTDSAKAGDSQLKKLDKTVGDNFRNVGNYKSAIGGLKTALGSLGIAFGARQVVGFLKESIDLSRIQEKAVAQVAAGLISTDKAVGYSLDELKAKASEFQKSTLFGDEQIMTDLTSVMLTFTNVTGEAFDGAQQAALDLSTRMGGDLKSAAVQLGKALNDPIKGVTALKKVGVSFTEEQQKQIKTLQESGDLYGAQAIILKEMNKEFAGSAKAAADADGGMTQLSNAWGDAKEQLGKMLIDGLKPTITALKEFFLSLTTEDISSFIGSIGTIAKTIGKVLIAFTAYLAISKSIQAYNFLMTGGLKKVAAGMMDVFKAGKQAGEGAKVAGEGVSKAGKAMTAVPWMAIIAVVVELGLAFYKMASGADDAARAQKGLNDAISDGQKFGDSLNKTIDEDYEKSKRNLDLKKSQGKLTEQQYKVELQNLKELRLGRIKWEMQIEKEEKAKATKTLKGLKKYYDAAMATMSVFRSTEQVQVIARFEAAQEELRQSNEVLSKLYAQKKSIDNLSVDEKIQENTEARAKNSAVVKEDTKAVRENTVALIEAEEWLNSQREATRLLKEERHAAAMQLVEDMKSAEMIDVNRKKSITDLRVLEAELSLKRLEGSGNTKAIKKAEEELRQARIAAVKAQLEIDLKLTDDINEQNYLRKKADLDILNLGTKKLEQQVKNKKTEEELIKAAADFFILQSNRKIEQIDKEIAAANTQYTTLQTLAANGNINAKESLAEQQRIINEANAQKERELKKQQRIKLAESVYSTYNAKVAGGSEQPLLDTIKDTMLLQQFIASLPTFYDGTEDTGKNGNGIDNKGGFHAILHPNERVIPKSLNEQIGGLSNEALAKMANEYQNGKIIRSNSQLGSSFDTAILVNEIKDLKDAIKSKPETNIEIGEITQSVMEIVKSTKQGNTTTYNRYKVRR